jgi:uncharacterized protein involved in exopolysaccharide biosynthesis
MLRNRKHDKMPDPSFAENREISFRHLAFLVTENWRTLLLAATIAFFIAVIALLLIQPRYTIAMKVTAIPQQNGTGNISGLGAITGLSTLLKGQTDEQFRRYQTALTTVELGHRMLSHSDLIQNAFPGSWDAKQRIYRPRKRLLGPLYALLGEPSTAPFTGATVAEYLSDRLKIDQPEDQTDIITISISSPDPTFAIKLLQTVHHEAVEMLRTAAAERADRMISYLRDRLITVTVQDSRVSLLSLMAEQENLRLLSQPGVSYAAEILDPPHSSDLPTFPKPALFLAIAIVIGSAIGFVLVILLDAFGISAKYPLQGIAKRFASTGVRRGILPRPGTR